MALVAYRERLTATCPKLSSAERDYWEEWEPATAAKPLESRCRVTWGTRASSANPERTEPAPDGKLYKPSHVDVTCPREE